VIEKIPEFLDELNVYVADAEFVAEPGEMVDPVSWSIYDVRQDTMSVYSREEVLSWRFLPFDTGPESVVVTFSARAESNFLERLGLGSFRWWIDLQAEDRALNNVILGKGDLMRIRKKRPTLAGANLYRNLINVCRSHGITDADVDEKETVRQIIMDRVWEHDSSVWPRILKYNASDVKLTWRLFQAMEPELRIDAAIVRGTYTAIVGKMETRGLPFDVRSYRRMQQNYPVVLRDFIDRADPQGVFLTPKGRVREAALREHLDDRGLLATWPRTRTGHLRRKVRA